MAPSKKHVFKVGDKVKYLDVDGAIKARIGHVGVLTTTFDRDTRKATEFLGKVKWDEPLTRAEDYVYEDEVEYIDDDTKFIQASATNDAGNGRKLRKKSDVEQSAGGSGRRSRVASDSAGTNANTNTAL